MFRRVTVFLCVLAVLIFNISYFAFADELTGSIEGRVIGEMIIPRHPIVMEGIDGKDIGNWVVNKDKISKKVIFKKAVISIENIKTETDNNGYFVLTDVPVGQHTMKVFNAEEKLIASQEVNVTSGKVTKIKVNLNYEIDKGKGCCSEAVEDNNLNIINKAFYDISKLFSTKEAFAISPCNDYNGPFGDCVNYSQSNPKAWRNFIGSDCDYAMGSGYCWNELMPGVSCEHNYGSGIWENCSWLVGCQSTHHCH